MSPFYAPLALLFALSIFVITQKFLARKRPRRLPLPPGPRGVPIFGNVFNYPSSSEWSAFRDVGLQHNSDIIHYNMLGKPIIVLNTLAAVNDLFGKRSSLYSDKPKFTMVDMIGMPKWNFAFQPYGDRWKKHRKIFHQIMAGPNLVAAQQPHIEHAARKLIQNIYARPAEFDDDLRLYAGQVILRVGYGIDVPDNHDPFIVTAEEGMSAVVTASTPGKFLVEVFPFLKYVPSWMPGAGFNRWASKARTSVEAMRDAPLRFVEKCMADGNIKPSLASSLLGDIDNSATDDSTQEYKRNVGNVLATIYAGGAHTVPAAITTFMLAMVQNPRVVRKAQAQIDQVVGPNRLPDFSDYEALPYIVAIVKETLRWEPVSPLALPHRLEQDDVYCGYHIPKGSTVIGNAWAILHDKSVYGADADAFNPDRFLTDAGQLDESIPHPNALFGFGRRVCPGQLMAESTLWMAMVSILAVFDFTKAVDGHGRTIDVPGEYLPGMIIRHPKPFECSIAPRSPTAVDLILIAYDERVGGS